MLCNASLPDYEVPRTCHPCVCRPLYSASSGRPVSVLIPYPRQVPEVLIMWSKTVRQSKTENRNDRKFMGQASEMPAYRVREHHNTKQNQEIRTYNKAETNSEVKHDKWRQEMKKAAININRRKTSLYENSSSKKCTMGLFFFIITFTFQRNS